jgi:hypothetical protein
MGDGNAKYTILWLLWQHIINNRIIIIISSSSGSGSKSCSSSCSGGGGVSSSNELIVNNINEDKSERTWQKILIKIHFQSVILNY